MSKLDKYTIALSDVQLDRLQDASIAISGLTSIADIACSDEDRPDWWGNYYDGVLIAALRCAASRLDEITDQVVDQRGQQDRQADGGEGAV
ncbi:hypothetical protein [Salinisphaera sp. T31B1]|uniref:hypothetical protein n=1 Tax=Salinisphaera sp. T31B1 TaxID=727963 RepID=UPI00333F74C9